ncbi:thioredoxin-disulfide reductase [Rathayibacter toxicus]|uniref:Thioredoxin reductase n=1 Tax=Rathayibacter toxicus TaxID=145458 RepID=A0A2S5YA23_9MICO|nr:thioredoxin-disulfide reductase [Rathayibacter toxicus]PPH25583.1 thioredoxin-disulfide reductase [Rathayibacter toxicus]PPH59282.1 thioredoxin-disulfide reductase [Rathayibacter toxicus]PPH61395.1 thioredoxin-disulfide reductase [Rathayibacter toxicus]PPH89361.1 thioredoxin-disulfide reductase [Rathayibacter toxicus]PPI17185.1 thioredoxin-disulfide reductase [Rathayibacter toxicus]
MRDIVIIGSGPAAWTAAIYAARAELHPVVVASSVEVGGELMNTSDVENFPGFPDGILGPELMTAMQTQAEKFGTETLYDDVTSLDLESGTKIVHLGSGKRLDTRSVVVATGSAYRKLGIPDEDRLSGYGVSWCATCDGFFFKGKTVAVVGGGDSAMEEATFLTKHASKVYIIHRKDSLRASKVMQKRAFNNEKIEFLWNSEVTAINGESHVNGIILRDTLNGTESHLELDGVFIAIGNDPRTHIVHGKLDLTAEGTIAVLGRSSNTSVAGVFAAGDVIDPTYRQAVTAAASGTVAALDAEHYLAGLDDGSPTTAGIPHAELIPR